MRILTRKDFHSVRAAAENNRHYKVEKARKLLMLDCL
jgi:hypothetical protein